MGILQGEHENMETEASCVRARHPEGHCTWGGRSICAGWLRRLRICGLFHAEQHTTIKSQKTRKGRAVATSTSVVQNVLPWRHPNRDGGAARSHIAGTATTGAGAEYEGRRRLQYSLPKTLTPAFIFARAPTVLCRCWPSFKLCFGSRRRDCLERRKWLPCGRG